MKAIDKSIIEYTYDDGAKNFAIVEADSPEEAVRIFRFAGRGGWAGVDFADFQIVTVSPDSDASPRFGGHAAGSLQDIRAAFRKG